MNPIITLDSLRFLDQIKHLWRVNSRTLGFFPEGAFQEHASQGQVLVAHTQQGEVLGYLLFRVSRERVVIVHLCIAQPYRRQHIAQRLVEHLSGLTKGYRGIVATCRRDFEANNLWPRLGFVAISERLGRGRDRAPLTDWWFDHSTPDLLASIRSSCEPDRLRAVLDANVFYDIHNDPAPDTAESKSLVANWLEPFVELALTRETLNEINRNSKASERSHHRRLARTYTEAICEPAIFKRLRLELRELFPNQLSPSDESDIRQLAWAIGSGAKVFLTRDGELLKLESKIYERYGLSVLRPSSLILHLDEVRERAQYHPARIAGSLTWARIKDTPDDIFVKTFQCFKGGETKKNFRERLCAFLADPRRYQSFELHSPEGDLLACVVYERANARELTIPLFRVRDPQHGVTIQRNLLLRALKTAASENRVLVRVTDQYCEEAVRAALREDYFTETSNGWVKVTLRGQYTTQDLASLLARIGREMNVEFTSLAQLSEHVRQDVRTARLIERQLWPVKLIDAPLKSFIVPIKPIWAKELFDERLANEDLFGAHTTLGLKREAVYYRAATPSCGLMAPARILWYVSGDKKYCGAMNIRACSYLEGVVTGKPGELFRRFNRLGIYKWADILSVAKGDHHGKVMAMRFSDTELLEEPVSWAQLTNVGRKYGMKLHLQSPVKIPSEVFHELYGMSMVTPRLRP